MYVSEREALNYAIEILESLENTTFHQGVIERLEYIRKRTHNIWTVGKIEEEIRIWTEKNGRPPYHNEFGSDNLPYHSTVKKFTGKSATVLVREMYPEYSFKSRDTSYPYKTKEEWLDAFRAEYNRIKPRTAKEFNLKKSKAIPQWQSISRHCGAVGWRELLLEAGVETTNLKNRSLYSTCELILTSSSVAIGDLQRINDERRKLNEELRIISSTPIVDKKKL